KDFEGAFAMMAQQRPDVLLVLQDALTLRHRKQIIDFALRERLPSMFVGKEWVQEGGLMAYGDSLPDRYRRAASIVDRILHGAKPADLPWSNPPSLNCSSTSRPRRRSGWPSRRHSSPAPTRCSNEAARVYHARRRRGCVAARGARATRADAPHWR